MYRILAILTAAALLTACNNQQPTFSEGGVDGVTSTQESKPADVVQPKAESRKPQVLPSGFVLPFAHQVRANRHEKLGGSTKRRVVAEIRGVPLEEADTMISGAVEKNGYSRLERSERDNGFIVSYRMPDGEALQTSFFGGQGVNFDNPDATGIVHVTWIVRR